MSNLIFFLGVFIFTSASLLIGCLLFILGRHFCYQYGKPKVTGKYGEYVYYIDQYGWTSYKLYFSRKKSILGVKLWWVHVGFGETKSMIFVDESMTPTQLETWVKDSLERYEAHLRTWGEV